MTRRRLAALAVAVVAAAAIVAWRQQRDGHALPPTIVSEDVVADLSQRLDPARVAAGSVQAGPLRPGNRLDGQGERPSLVAPPPARVRFPLTVPPGGVLRFGVGVQGDGRRDTARSGVVFRVSIDGRTVWTRAVNPAARRRDRRWVDERIDLAPWAGRSIDVELATAAEDSGHPLAGTPGWGTVRLVRETAHARQPASPEAPNVLVLLVDTLRADAVGFAGATPSPTPELDRFAAGGLVFTQAIAQSSWTLPSVASLFTGLNPRSHGAIGVDDSGAVDASWGFLGDGNLTIAEQASRAGVTTMGVSANPLVSRGTNLAQGFETFIDLPWEATTKGWGTAAEVRRTFLDWLAMNRQHRFLAYLHYMEPHDPYTPPPAMRPPPPPGMRADLAAGWVLDVSRKLNWGDGTPLPPDQVAYLRALYDGEIRVWDAELPALLDGLDRLGLRDSTVVVVTADHGEEFQEHGLLLHRSHLFDELIRVPLLLAGPGIAPGRRGDPVQGIDLFPTLAALLGVDAPPGLPGRNLLSAPGPPRPAFSETDGLAADRTRTDLVSVRTPPWKLIEAPRLAQAALFDLARDPGEHAPLPPDTDPGPALRSALQRLARDAPPPPERGGADPALREKLRALGYAD